MRLSISRTIDAPNRPSLPDPSLDWASTIPWLREHTSMQIWLKGVCSPADVELAIHYGVNGIVISNHGGRQLDGVPATLDSLRLCAEVAKGRIPLAIDGGIRRGSDIFKALALGASYCFMGRIPIWGLAVRLTFLIIYFPLNLWRYMLIVAVQRAGRSRASYKDSEAGVEGDDGTGWVST